MRWRWLALALAACLGLAAPSSAAPFVYVTDIPGGIVSEYDAATGALVPLRSAGLAGVNPFGVAVTPDGTSVYAVDVGDGSSLGTVSQYDVAADGSLTPKTPRTVLAGHEPFEIAVNPDGKAAYVTNVKDGTVSQYGIGPGGALSPTIPATVAAGFQPAVIAVSPNGKSVYITGTDGLRQYSVGFGDTLTPKKPAKVPSGNPPGHVAISPDGKSAYVTDPSGNAVWQYNIGADGRLHPKTPATVATGNSPGPVAVSPDGHSVYVADVADGLIAQFAVSATGLVLKAPETIAAGGFPADLVVSPTGRNVYATDRANDALFEYSGGNGPGTLTPLSPASVPFTTPGNPGGIAIGPTQIRFSCGGVIEACSVQAVPVSSGGSTTSVVFNTRLVRAAPVGILVARIVGNRRVPVGRVPFGLKRTGPLRIRWHLRVGGHRLHMGRYLITLRMFDRRGRLIALAHPVAVTIR